MVRFKNQRVSGILFDLDGVILDSMAWHIRAWQEVLLGYDISLDEEFLYLNEGAIEFSHLLDILETEGLGRKLGRSLEPGDIKNLLAEHGRRFNRRYADKVRPYPDAEGVLAGLSGKGLSLGLVTSSSREVVDRILPAGITGLFDSIVTGDMVGRGKPHPEPYLTGLAALGLDRSRTLAVENAPAGIRSAKAAGLTCLALTTTLRRRHLDQADFVFPDLSCLAAEISGKG